MKLTNFFLTAATLLSIAVPVSAQSTKRVNFELSYHVTKLALSAREARVLTAWEANRLVDSCSDYSLLEDCNEALELAEGLIQIRTLMLKDTGFSLSN